VLSPDLEALLSRFYDRYEKAASCSKTESLQCFFTFRELIAKVMKEPFQFAPFHEAIRAPIDHYRFGLDYVRPLIDFGRSKVNGEKALKSISEALQKGENVILLANHQTEIDPQVLSLMLEKKYPGLAEKMIFVAGHRVVTDPLAVPFSMGRNLLCINSKKYLDNPPEKRAEKLLHNQQTLKKLEELLRAGGKCIYVAPSGGRDRKNSSGVIEVAPFDADSIEMFYLIAESARIRTGPPTHFHTLALST